MRVNTGVISTKHIDFNYTYPGKMPVVVKNILKKIGELKPLTLEEMRITPWLKDTIIYGHSSDVVPEMVQALTPPNMFMTIDTWLSHPLMKYMRVRINCNYSHLTGLTQVTVLHALNQTPKPGAWDKYDTRVIPTSNIVNDLDHSQYFKHAYATLKMYRGFGGSPLITSEDRERLEFITHGDELKIIGNNKEMRLFIQRFNRRYADMSYMNKCAYLNIFTLNHTPRFNFHDQNRSWDGLRLLYTVKNGELFVSI